MRGRPAQIPTERFWKKVDKNGPVILHDLGPCWIWTGGKDYHGYGKFSIGSWLNQRGKDIPAHRFAYEHMVGPIPEGAELDHLCRNHSCVNPAHLEPVTHETNMQKGLAGKVNNPQTAKTHCPRGHLYDYVNKQGKRECRICHREKTRIRRGSLLRGKSPYYDGKE